MNSQTQLNWEEFLNPEVLRPRLIEASLFIAAFELLKDCIQDRIRNFFSLGFNEKGDIIDPEYKTDVLGRNSSPVYASLAWLKEMGAIDEADIEAFNRVKDCRNLLAHRLLQVVSSEGLPPDFGSLFAEMHAILRKVEIWWIKNVDMATDPAFDGTDIDEAEIIPGPVMGLHLLYDIALGSKEQSRYYYEALMRRAKNASGSRE